MPCARFGTGWRSEARASPPRRARLPRLLPAGRAGRAAWLAHPHRGDRQVAEPKRRGERLDFRQGVAAADLAAAADPADEVRSRTDRAVEHQGAVPADVLLPSRSRRPRGPAGAGSGGLGSRSWDDSTTTWSGSRSAPLKNCSCQLIASNSSKNGRAASITGCSSANAAASPSTSMANWVPPSAVSVARSPRRSRRRASRSATPPSIVASGVWASSWLRSSAESW